MGDWTSIKLLPLGHPHPISMGLYGKQGTCQAEAHTLSQSSCILLGLWYCKNVSLTDCPPPLHCIQWSGHCHPRTWQEPVHLTPGARYTHLIGHLFQLDPQPRSHFKYYKGKNNFIACALHLDTSCQTDFNKRCFINIVYCSYLL